MRNIEVYQRRK